MKSSPSLATETKSHYEGHRQRLKDKFNTVGAAAFADYELLELLLFQVIPRSDTKPLAKALIDRFGGLLGVVAAPIPLLKEIKGVGDNVIHALKLQYAVIGRALKQDIHGKCVLQSWQQVIDYCTATMAYDDKEQLRLLYLDQKNQVLCDEIQQTGTVNHTPIYPREVMKRAFEVGASSLIMVHNHPSGDPTPSRADIDLTLKIQRIGNDLGVKLHDHVIIGKGRHSSLKSLGIL
ncbi:RadC family protein [Candidatus Odyssella acanthamoebae]|uniref:RadC family protein n=1 Tax=Candidatus Odyssella acanthamoebae TaxID=91604 RepID=UPI00068F6EC7|nr:DNA repair protein RadC [Candidatus Paracaedibacter acanthamoebae]